MKIVFVGDVLLSDEGYRGKNSLLSDQLLKKMKRAEVRCCNLEGAVASGGMLSAAKAGPSVRQGEKAIVRLSESGFNYFNLANNHIMDYGKAGLKNTLGIITEVDSAAQKLGADCDAENIYSLHKVYDRNELCVGIISACERGFGVNVGDIAGYAYMLDERFMKLLERANRECDYSIVICHCGAEELEVPLPEVRALYRYFIDKGADLVIGHHPHVIQGSEVYGKGKIFYSLGNFAFDSLSNPLQPYNPKGLLVMVNISRLGVEFEVLTTMYRNGIVSIDEQSDEYVRRSKLLQNEKEYLSMVNEFCSNIYEEAYKTYCCQAVGFHDKSIYQKICMALKLLSGRKIEYNETFIYHNIAIETNQWIVRRAIELKNGDVTK